MSNQNTAITIIHVSSALSWRGGEQQIAYLLTELSKQGIQQILICPQDSPLNRFCIKNSIQVKPFRKRSGFDPGLALRISQVCRRSIKPIIHAHDSHSHNSAFLSAFLWLNKTPLIVHRRVGFSTNNNFLGALKYNHSTISRIICVSENVRSTVNSGHANSKKTVTVYDGIDLNKFKGKTNSNILRNRFNINSQQPIIGNISAITAEKDLTTFVDTAAILLKKNPELRFFIIGDGAERQQISDYIKLKALEDKIFLTGFMENIEEILMELDLLLFTSVNEGLGTSLLDAFACRIPVVATNAGGIPEIVENRVTGLTVEIRNPSGMAEAVEEVLNNPELRNNIIKNAFLKVQKFSTEKMAAKIFEIYNEVYQSSE